jgi:FAD/FMN-containing dehydrogenase
MVAPYTVDGKEPIVAGLMMDKMTQVLEVDKANHRLRVQGQMKLKELYETADANGMSIPRSALPWWQGLTLAGTFSTTSHGTGNNVTSMIVSIQG